MDALKQRRADGTALTGTLDDKQPLVDRPGLGDQLRQVLKPGEDVEVFGLVDDGFDPERAAVPEVLLDTGMLRLSQIACSRSGSGLCTCFPYPAKVWLNGHEWAKRQADHAGVDSTALSNGFAAGLIKPGPKSGSEM